MKLSIMSSAFVGASLLLSLSTHAALVAVDLDGNAINGHEGVYDDVLDITWLADANLASSNTFDVTGINGGGTMTWAKAEEFIDAMNTYSGNGYLGVNTWRQPTVAALNGSTFNTTFTYDGSTDSAYQISSPVDGTYNQSGDSAGFTGSELAYHYYNNFGAIGACSGVGSTNTYGCVASGIYGIDDAPDPKKYKTNLFNNTMENSIYWTGTEVASFSAFYFNASAGHQGTNGKDSYDYVWAVADGNVGTVIPVPAAAWLFGSALIGLVVLQRRS